MESQPKLATSIIIIFYQVLIRLESIKNQDGVATLRWIWSNQLHKSRYFFEPVRSVESSIVWLHYAEHLKVWVLDITNEFFKDIYL